MGTTSFVFPDELLKCGRHLLTSCQHLGDHGIGETQATPGQRYAPPIIMDQPMMSEMRQPIPGQIIKRIAGLRGKLFPDYARSRP